MSHKAAHPLQGIYYFLHHWLAPRDQRGQPSAGPWHTLIRRVCVRLCAGDRGRLLELGCGEGLFLEQVSGVEGLCVFGVDLDDGQLRRAGQRLKQPGRNRVHLVLADALRVPFADDVFDRLVCINLLVNLKKEEGMVDALLASMRRVCKPGGRIIVEFRNSANPFVWLKYRYAHYYDGTLTGMVLRTYSEQWIARKLAACGFRLTQRIGIGFPVRALAPVIVLEARKEGLDA